MGEVTPKQPTVRVGIVYNTFKPDEIQWHDLPYSEGATIKDYVGDMAEGTWSVGYKGNAYHSGEWENIVLEEGAAFSFIQVPEGGGSTKDVLRIVAMLAIMFVAYAYVGPWAMAKLAPESAGILGMTAAKTGAMYAGMAQATFAMAGMMAVNAIIPPAGMVNQKEGARNYGIDGPKNTAKEGPVVPVGFGRYRTAGNIVDSFTKLEGQTQYLYMRMIVNDGPIKSAGEFQINGENAANYDGVTTRVSLGTQEGEANDWFGEAIRMQSIGETLDTNWTVRTTNTEVDRVRIDLLYPEGLGYWKDDGKVLARESGIQFRYRKVGDTTWLPLAAATEVPFVGMGSGIYAASGYGRPPIEADAGWTDWANGISPEPTIHAVRIYNSLFGGITVGVPLYPEVQPYGTLAESVAPSPISGLQENIAIATVPQGAGRVSVNVRGAVFAADNSSTGHYAFGLYYREVGATEWILAGTEERGSVTRTRSGSTWANFPLVYRNKTLALNPAKRYQITVFGGVVNSASALVPSGSGTVTFNKVEKESFRYCYESGVLPRGRYEVGVRRTIADDDNPKSRDSIHWTDLAEIDIENIHYVGTANIALKIKVSEQLQSIPTFTAMVEASTVDHYDMDGKVTHHDWSPWPCWHAVDVLRNQDRGRGLPVHRIDWPSVVEWERHCIENNLQFNGVFDQKTNVWDAIQQLCRVGHAQLVRQGTKYSFVVDKKSDPVQMFNDSNIIEGTFTTTWLGMDERANEIHYTYYPTALDGKEDMLRVVDPIAMALGEEPRVLPIQEKGVTSREQAMFNIEKQLRENRLITKTVSFDAPLESISLTIGDVALIQHSSAHYGKGIGSGLLKAGSTASRLLLDCPIKMEEGKDYRVLAVNSAIKRYTAVIERKSGKTLYVSGLPEGELERCTRLKRTGRDVRIDNILSGNPHDRIIVSDATGLIVGQTVELWDTDVIEERQVVYAAGEVEQINLVTPLSAAPATHARWVVGPVESVRAPYRLRSISGDDLYRRSLSFVEYNDAVYEPLGADYQRPVPPPSTLTPHVVTPSISWPVIVDGQATRVTVTVAWERGDANYAGADLYVARNGEDFKYARSVADVTSVEMEASLGDDLQVKIVAYGRNSLRQNANTAPVVGGVIEASREEIAAVTITSVDTPKFKVEATVRVQWSAATSASVKGYRVEYAPISQGEKLSGVVSAGTEWTLATITDGLSVEIPNLTLGYYAFRVRAENGRAFSPWATSTYEVTPPELPLRVTGLRLDHAVAGVVTDQFVGQNAKFVWNDVAGSAVALGAEAASAEGMDFYWRDYLVRVKALDGTVIREEITRNAFYEYTLEKNKEDCRGTSLTARRAFRVEVSMRGRQGQESDAIGMNVSNPSPLPPVVMHRIEGVDSIMFAFRPFTEVDVEGVMIWAKETSGFSPTIANVDYRGPDPFPTLKLKPKKTYYVRVAAYDALGTEGLTFSDEFVCATSGLTNEYFDESFYDGAIPPDIMERIMLIDGDGVGSVNARLAGVRSEIDAASDALNQRIDTITSTGGNRVFYQTSEPVATSGNDLWINPSDNNRFKRWNGVSWEYVDDARINSLTSYIDNRASALASDIDAVATQANEVRATALTRNRTFRQASAPTSTAENPLTVGDLWYDTSNGNKSLRWGGASIGWQETSDIRFEQLAASIQNEANARVAGDEASATQLNLVSAVANSRNRIFRQNTAPSNPVTGDLWIDTTNVRLPNGTNAAGNVLKRWSGSAWVETNDPRIAASAAMVETLNTAVTSPTGSVATSINNVKAQAEAKNKTFYQAAAPTTTSSYTLAVGDLWYKTNENNKVFRWSGSAWQAADDGRIAINAAAITSEQSARADADSALSRRIDVVSATAGSAKATAEAQAGAIATLEGKAKAWAQRTVTAGTSSATIEMKAETDGKQSISNITLLADEIGLGKTTDGTNRSVLRIRNGQTEINGTLSASAGIFLGSGTTVWPVALRSREFTIMDGVPLDFGVNLGTIPQYEISMIGLAPLNAGESYDLRLNNLTGTGCTPYLKINIPAQSSTINLTTDTWGAAGEPTRIIQRGSNAQSLDGNYTFSYQVYGNWEWYNPYEMEYVRDDPFYGTALVGIWKKSGGVWVKVAEETVHIDSYYWGRQSAGWQSHAATVDVVSTYQLGSNVDAFGVSLIRWENQGFGSNSNGGINDLQGVRWSVRGAGANVRSATPTGFSGKVTIRPQ